MCAPDHFEVDYVINPWMYGNRGKTDNRLAREQWDALRSALAVHAEIVLLKPQPGLPDMVFTANAGMVLGHLAVLSHFLAPERQGEEKHFRSWFEANGFKLPPWPEKVYFEGAGDALLDRGKETIWAGYGFRSKMPSPRLIEAIFSRPVMALQLVNPNFYHLDTCLCPLEGGYLMYYPAAFDEESQKRILDNVLPEKRIVVSDDDAKAFACNAVDIRKHIFMNGASAHLQGQLRAAGFSPLIVPLSEFMKAGGAAKCLTLKLVEP